MNVLNAGRWRLHALRSNDSSIVDVKINTDTNTMSQQLKSAASMLQRFEVIIEIGKGFTVNMLIRTINRQLEDTFNENDKLAKISYTISIDCNDIQSIGNEDKIVFGKTYTIVYNMH